MVKASKQKGHVCTPYVISDFETGGLKMDECGLTELAMIAIEGDSLREIGRYETLIAPHQLKVKGEWKDAVYTPKAFEVTGLNLEKLTQDGRDIDFVAKEVEEFLKMANVHNSKTGYKPVLVAHNAQYEVQCFQQLAEGRFELSKYFHGSVDFYGNFQPHYIDTLDLAKLLWNNNQRMTSYTLGSVLDKAGIPIVDAHRAMNDVVPSTDFFQMVINMLRVADTNNILSNLQSTMEDGKKVTNGRTFKFQFA